MKDPSAIDSPDQEHRPPIPDQDPVARLRAEAVDQVEDAPRARRSLWAPREVGGQSSPWIARGLLLALLLILVVEAIFAFSYLNAEPEIVIDRAPTVQAPPAPPVGGGYPAPPIEVDESILPPTAPVPTPSPGAAGN